MLLSLGIRYFLVDHLTTLIHRPVINPAGHIVGGPGHHQGPGPHRPGPDNRSAPARALNGCPPWTHISLSAPGAFRVSPAGTRGHRGAAGVHIIPRGGGHGIAPGTNRGRAPGAGYRGSAS